jgi:hypothetical protein
MVNIEMKNTLNLPDIVTPLLIEFNSDDDTGEHNDDSSEYHSYTKWTFDAVYLADGKRDYNYGEPFDYCGDVKAGDKIYLVYAVWTSGDSMGTSHGANCEPIYVSKYEYMTKKVELNLRGLGKQDPNEKYVAMLWDNGMMTRYYPSWHHYFESLDYVLTIETIVQ